MDETSSEICRIMPLSQIVVGRKEGRASNRQHCFHQRTGAKPQTLHFMTWYAKHLLQICVRIKGAMIAQTVLEVTLTTFAISRCIRRVRILDQRQQSAFSNQTDGLTFSYFSVYSVNGILRALSDEVHQPAKHVLCHAKCILPDTRVQFVHVCQSTSDQTAV